MKRRVLLVGNFGPAAGGVVTVVEELSNELTRAGWSVICTSRRSSKLGRLIDMIGTIWRRRHEYDVAHVDVYAGYAYLWAEAACRMLRRVRRPYTITLHSGSMPQLGESHPTLLAQMLLGAEAVTTPSRYLYDNMKKYRADLTILPNPLHLANYSFRERHAFARRIIWIRSIAATYNPILVPRVGALLAKDFSDLRITMVGPTENANLLEELKRSIADLGVRDRVSVHGAILKQEIGSWLDWGDIFLNTSNSDNTPVTILEAMAAGLCIVSTDVEGIPYLLDHGNDALLVPRDDPDQMAVAVRKLLTDPALANRLSRNARRKAEQFDWSIILPQWESLLLEVAHGTDGKVDNLRIPQPTL